MESDRTRKNDARRRFTARRLMMDTSETASALGQFRMPKGLRISVVPSAQSVFTPTAALDRAATP